MAIDLPTLMVAVMLVSAVAGAAVLYVGATVGAEGSLRVWGAALLLYALQPLAFGWRFAGPLAASIVAANAVGTLVIALQWEAVTRFHRASTGSAPGPGPAVRGPTTMGLILIPLTAGLGALALIAHEAARNTFGTLMLLGTSSALVVATHRARLATGRPARGQHLLLGGSAILMGVLVWRVTAILLATQHTPTLPLDSGIHARTYLFTLVTLLLQTLGFVLWHKERAVEREHLLAVHDALTGCLNRRALFDVAGSLLSSLPRRARPIAVLMLDLDHFKAINDRHGHLTGDAVLREVAHRLQSRLRGSDLLARFGGEEFLVLADDTDDPGARTLAEQLRQSVADRPVEIDGGSLSVTVSIGVHVTAAGTSGVSMDTMIAAGDAALFRAKREGRNRVA